MALIHRIGRCALVGLIAASIGSAVATAPAAAEVGPELASFGALGSGAGQLDFTAGGEAPGTRAGGIAADPETGHLFISDSGNNRISEFTAWGEFVKAWGWGVRDGSPAPQVCTAETGCRRGLYGSAPGEISSPNGIALDQSGDVYLFERANRRVQVFTQAGEFSWMFGVGVNVTDNGDVCTKADIEGGDVCGAGTKGTGPGEFAMAKAGHESAGDYLDIGPDGTIHVGDQNRIQKFEPDGTFKGEVSFASLHAENPAFPDPTTEKNGLIGRNVTSLAVDQVSGDIYLTFAYAPTVYEGSSVWRLSAAGKLLAPLIVTSGAMPEEMFSLGVATDATGKAYVSAEPGGLGGLSREQRILQFDEAGGQIDSCCLAPFEVDMHGLATNTVRVAGGVDVYALQMDDPGVAFVGIFGPPPDKWPPPTAPPTVAAQFATKVTAQSATLQGEINPNFWADTSYRLEFGTSPCSEGGCQVVGGIPGKPLGAGIVKRAVKTGQFVLTDLEPGTTYHYRFASESSGGGPVFGTDPDGAGPLQASFGDGGEATFTTFSEAGGFNTGCPNQSRRSGPSAPLPDCRAYEMVSPVDKNGGDILVQCTSVCFLARLNQSSESGDEITYSSYRAFGDSPGSGYTSQYLAARDPVTGWSNAGISPPREGPSAFGFRGLDSQYKGFLPDLSSGWLLHDTEPQLAPGAIQGLADLYRRDTGTGGYETLTTTAPLIALEPSAYVPEFQGSSADGKRAFFAAQAKLTANASANSSVWQVYEAFDGQLRLVSVRPNGGAGIANASVGSVGGVKGGGGEGRSTNLRTAISADGSRVYWSETAGKLYVRVGGTKTYEVSAGAARFWAATPSGSEAIYTEDEGLRSFDLASKESVPIAASVRGVMGASTDLSRVYFVSTAALAEGAPAGKRNLYLYERGEGLTFIASFSADDFVGETSPVAPAPWAQTSRVTPDGQTAIFMSRTAMTGQENTDLNSGKPDAEVFRYDAPRDELLCVSCSPTGVRPGGKALKEEAGYWYASKVPGGEMQLHYPRSLAENGRRVFFQSLNRLVLEDTNGVEDVYEWEAPGSGDCSEAAAAYSATAGGCVALISYGQGTASSEFVDANADGRDVFFTTGVSLVLQDPDQVDLYDARELGGFLPPAQPPAPCEGEACQAAAVPPADPPYSSETFVGPRDPAALRTCNKKRFVKRHGKCIRRKGVRTRGGKHGKRQHQRPPGVGGGR